MEEEVLSLIFMSPLGNFVDRTLTYMVLSSNCWFRFLSSMSYYEYLIGSWMQKTGISYLWSLESTHIWTLPLIIESWLFCKSCNAIFSNIHYIIPSLVLLTSWRTFQIYYCPLVLESTIFLKDTPILCSLRFYLRFSAQSRPSICLQIKNS